MRLEKHAAFMMVCLCLIGSSGCIDGNGDDRGVPRAVTTILGREVDTFLYILQNIDLTAVIKSEYDFVIMDYSADGSEENAFTNEEIRLLRDSGKIVVSYLSIGEAEDYRYYWQENWTVGDPEFIESENPDWKHNYKVKYWEREWQDIIFSANDSYLDRILDAGFQGVYLDIVDAYEYFEEQGREAAARGMVDFVLNITDHSMMRDPGFLVIPQNGEGLLIHDDYLQAISGQGKEDLFFVDDEKQDREETDYSLGLLRNATDSGRFVLVTDYPTKDGNIETFYQRSADEGFLAFRGNRDLDTIPELR